MLPSIGPRRAVYRDRYQAIYQVTADFGEFTKEYFVRDSGHRTGVVVVRNGSVLLVRQYRLIIHGLSWEIPGGKVDEGETPESAAARECLEETGIQCTALKPLLDFHPGLDISYNPTHLFYAEEFVATDQARQDPGEVVLKEWVPLERCLNMILEGAITDSLSIIGLLTYHMIR